MEKLEIMIKLANERNIDQVSGCLPVLTAMSASSTIKQVHSHADSQTISPHAGRSLAGGALANTECDKLGRKAALRVSWQQPWQDHLCTKHLLCLSAAAWTHV